MNVLQMFSRFLLFLMMGFQILFFCGVDNCQICCQYEKVYYCGKFDDLDLGQLVKEVIIVGCYVEWQEKCGLVQQQNKVDYVEQGGQVVEQVVYC